MEGLGSCHNMYRVWRTWNGNLVQVAEQPPSRFRIQSSGCAGRHVVTWQLTSHTVCHSDVPAVLGSCRELPGQWEKVASAALR